MTAPELSTKRRAVRSVCLLLLSLALIGTLPRPTWLDVATSESETSGRWAFRSARRLVELSGKGTTSDDTELSGPCLADDGQTLYFTRTRPGLRADIVRSRLNGSRWSRPDPVRELNSVDDDRRVTIGADNRSLIVASNRSGTRGGFDLSESTGTSGRWSRPKSVGTAINTAADEFDPSLSPDGLMLLFARRAAGRSELFVSRREQVSAPWSAAHPVTSANSFPGDKLSPTFAADGRGVWFVVQRTESIGAASNSELFQAPLANGQIGSALPIRDAIVTGGSIADPALSDDGHSLIFASHRDGGLQLYQAQAEWVVSRLSVSTTHLDRFGRAKWGVPIGLAILLIVFARMTRRTNRDAERHATIPRRTQQAVPATVGGVSGPVHRNAPPVNPLANWKAVQAETPARTAKQSGEPAGVSRRTVAPVAPVRGLTPAGSPEIRTGQTARPTRRVRLRRVAGLLPLAALAIFGIWTRDRWLPPAISYVPSDWSQFHEFRDITAVTRETLSPIARAATSRKTAPELQAVAAEATLRQTARWPNEFVVVRAPAPLFVAPAAIPELTGIAKVTAFTRPVTLGPKARADRGFVELIPAEPITLAIEEPALEKPIAAAPGIATSRLSDPPTRAVSGLTPTGWPSGMQSPAKLYLAPNELVPVQPPTMSLVSISGFGANRNNSVIAVPADVDPALPLTQPLNDLSLAVAPSPLPRAAVANISPLPTFTQTKSANVAVEPRASGADLSASRSEPTLVSNGVNPRLLAVERRAPREATAITASPEAGATPPGQTEPTILLTSAQSMTELFPAAPISVLGRMDSLASAAKPAELPPISLAGWLRELLMPPAPNGLPTEAITTSSPPRTALPYRIKDTSAAAIPETVIPVFE